MKDRIGFMQGRLSPQVEGRIQAFPWTCWQEEFPLAERHDFHLMEWTLDQERLYENPLLTPEGQAQIRALCNRHSLTIGSLTGDCFMQAPFWKAAGSNTDALQRDFRAIAEACAAVGISMIVVPLVDNGRLDTPAQENALVSFLSGESSLLRQRGLKVAFESDLGPEDLARFIGQLDSAAFGINYDIGNSAAMGFDSAEELTAYGNRVVNVHIKDRVLGGTTVPLGTGNADFDRVFGALARVGYTGNYILQTARAHDGNHAEALVRYRDMAVKWIETHGA
ncbi:MAG: sugar phosphate isomerase/epimerase family protein [Steroidobacteraceae bacterium]